MIIDTHTHPFGFPSFRNLSDKIQTAADLATFRTKYPELYKARLTEKPVDFVDELIEKMDEYRIDKAFVQATPGRLSNQQVANAVKKYPGRLFGLGRVGHDQQARGYADDPTPAREAAPEEIARCREEYGFNGMGEITARSFTLEIHPERVARDLKPIMDAVAKYKMPIMFPTGWTQFPGQLYFADPVFVDEIAARYPDVPIVLTKMGRGIDHYFQSALAVAMRNVNIYFDTVGTTSNHLSIAVETIGSERIMFGTDWSGTWMWVRKPADLHSTRLKTVKDAKLSKPDEENILWKTASRVFGI
jgi:predicted TIM-barrel fold metal-dependent hydrolase